MMVRATMVETWWKWNSHGVWKSLQVREWWCFWRRGRGWWRSYRCISYLVCGCRLTKCGGRDLVREWSSRFCSVRTEENTQCFAACTSVLQQRRLAFLVVVVWLRFRRDPRQKSALWLQLTHLKPTSPFYLAPICLDSKTKTE